MRWVVAPMMIALALAGCVSTGHAPQIIDSGAPNPAVLEDFGPLKLLGDSHVYGLRSGPLASMTYIQTDSDGAEHELAVDFLGISPAIDEWSRTVSAFHFRTDEIRYVYTGNGDFPFSDDEFEPAVRERYRMFDAADGRSIGVYAPDYQSRGFADPEIRTPFTTPTLDLMAIKNWRAFGSHSVEGASISFEPGAMEGPCRVHTLRITDDPDSTGLYDYVGYESDSARSYTVCVASDDDAPHWIESASDDEWVRWDRQGPGMLLPQFTGDVLVPHEFERAAFDVTPSLIPLIPDMHTFPAASPDDWAGQVQARAAALLTNPDYLLYAIGREDVYVHDATVGWPVWPLIHEPWQIAGFTSHSWIQTTDGDGFFWGFVYTREQPEQESLHVADDGFDFTTLSTTKYPALDGYDGLVRVGDAIDRLQAHIPGTAEWIGLTTWPDFQMEVFEFLDIAGWFNGVGTCFGDVPDDRFGMVDNVDGNLMAVGYAFKASSETSASCATAAEGAQIFPGFEPFQIMQIATPDGLHTAVRLPTGELLQW